MRPPRTASKAGRTHAALVVVFLLSIGNRWHRLEKHEDRERIAAVASDSRETRSNARNDSRPVRATLIWFRAVHLSLGGARSPARTRPLSKELAGGLGRNGSLTE